MTTTWVGTVRRTKECRARPGEEAVRPHPGQEPALANTLCFMQWLLLPPKDGVLLVQVRAGAEGDETGEEDGRVRKGVSLPPPQPALSPKAAGHKLVTSKLGDSWYKRVPSCGGSPGEGPRAPGGPSPPLLLPCTQEASHWTEVRAQMSDLPTPVNSKVAL